MIGVAGEVRPGVGVVPAGDAPVEVRVVRSWGELAATAADWEPLALRSQDATVFQSWEWTDAWWASFGADRQLYVLEARAAGRLVGLAPLVRRRLGPFRMLEFLGAGRTDFLQLLVDPEHPSAVPALAASLNERAGEWDLLWLRDMPLEPAAATRLCGQLRDAGLQAEMRTWDVAPYLTLGCSWSDYLASRSANFRSDLKRKRRRLEDEGPVTIERHRAPTAVRSGLLEAAEIERHSWKQEAGSARMAEAGGPRFFQAAAGALAGKGAADLWLLRVGEAAVAFYLNFVSHDRILYYSGTYRKEWHAASPGKVLMAEAIRAACDEGYAVFDFLRGAEAYKSTWTGTERPLYEAFVASRRPVSRLAARLVGDLALPAKRHPIGRELVRRMQRLRGS